MKNKIHYAWFICLACFLLLFCTSGLSASGYNVFQPYIIEWYKLSNTQLSTISTVKYIASLSAVLYSTRYYKKFTLRQGMFIAGLMDVLAYFIYSIAHNFFGFLLGNVLVGVAASLGGGIPVVMMLSRWFNEKRTIALGIGQVAGSIACIGFPTLTNRVVQQYGQKTAFLGMMAIMAVFTVVSFLLLRNSPAELGMQPYGRQELLEAGEKKGFKNTRLDKKDWIILGIAVVLFGGVINAAANHLTIYFNSEGISVEVIAIIISLQSVGAGIGKFSYGWFSEKLGGFTANTIYFDTLTLGLLLLVLFVHVMPIFVAANLISNFGITLGSVAMISWIWDLASPDQYQEAVQKQQLLFNLGAVVFNIFPGILADLCGGSFKPAFMLLTVISIPAALLVQSLYIRRMRAEQKKSNT